jgi:transcription initiation factor TFIIA large subunit
LIQSSSSDEHEITFTASSFSGEPLALESLPESVKELMREARDRAVKAGAISKRSRIAQLDGEAEDTATPAAINNNNTNNDDDINSDLDDSDDDDDDGEGGEEIEHIILCLYDKVTRTKNKWKCILKDGIMLVNGRDYLFHRANGDFEW